MSASADLLAEHLHLAEQIAFGIKKHLPAHVDLRDLIQDGRIGLLDAARRYEAGRRVPFGAYARRRISGSILDGSEQRMDG